MGTLKSRQLFRFSVDENRVIEQELLLDELARVRDIEAGADGEIYLLLEHADGSTDCAFGSSGNRRCNLIHAALDR
jgi:glucose/arabinose dehydrogenase